MTDRARVIEIFSSIQGEGVYVGKRHLFVRFWNCNLDCRYCDTDFKGPYTETDGAQLLARVERWLAEAGPFDAVSLTGGEPLLWSRFLKTVLPEIKRMSQRVYLETNGTLPDALRAVLPWIDIVAMDIKPPSATGDRPVWAEHEKFLRIPALGFRPELFVKVVVTGATYDSEIERVIRLIASVNRAIPLVLQPVTPFREVQEGPSPEQLGRWRQAALERLEDVRIIPQVHRILGVP